MATNSPLTTSLEVALRRLELCAYAVQEVHMEIDQPVDPDQKADLLLATENLAFEVVDLLRTVKVYAWGAEQEQSYHESESEED